MPPLFQHRHPPSPACQYNRGCLCVLRRGTRKTFHRRPERSASWPSLVLLDEQRGHHRHDLRVGGISVSQLAVLFWEDASRLPKIPAPCHSTRPPKANLGTGALLELSNSVRESLAKRNDLGPDANRLSFFLHLALVEEENGILSIDFETIKAARLDKLVAELTEWGEMTGDLLPRYVHDVVTAMRLEEMWRARFRIDYFMIDEIRAHELAVRWQLRERPAWRGSMTTLTSLVMGGPTPGVGREGEGNCKPGAWWLDIACARLDGVVGTEHETTSRGNDKVPTMPLLTGTEFNIGHDRVRYLREGTGADMHPALIPQTGKFVRVLRGYQLQSRFAPVAGIRNDGLWKVLRYSHRLNKTTGRCHLEVDLEKAPGQPPMSQLMKIPRPSHIDDWEMYQRAKTTMTSQTRKNRMVRARNWTE